MDIAKDIFRDRSTIIEQEYIYRSPEEASGALLLLVIKSLGLRLLDCPSFQRHSYAPSPYKL